MEINSFKNLIETPGLDCVQLETVSKTESKGIRWSFLYRSAIIAWKQLEFSQTKFDALMEEPTERMSDTTEDTESDEFWFSNDFTTEAETEAEAEAE